MLSDLCCWLWRIKFYDCLSQSTEVSWNWFELLYNRRRFQLLSPLMRVKDLRPRHYCWSQLRQASSCVENKKTNSQGLDLFVCPEVRTNFDFMSLCLHVCPRPQYSTHDLLLRILNSFLLFSAHLTDQLSAIPSHPFSSRHLRASYFSWESLPWTAECCRDHQRLFWTSQSDGQMRSTSR